MGDDWDLFRLPVRRVEARPEVAARLRGEDPPPVLPPERSSFPWQRPDVPNTADGSTNVSEPSAGTPQVSGWWEGIPAVRQLLLDGLDLGAATVFIGENGSGKSTLVEGIASAYGISSAGGSTGSRHRTPFDEPVLAEQLRLVRGGTKGRGGYFLRAEMMHGFFTYLAENPRPPYLPPDYDFLDMSHGESFVALVEDRFTPRRPGLYLLDEPESALSFDNQLRLLRHLQSLMATGFHQIIMATHSPILAALPDAMLYEVDDDGFHEVDHDDAQLVRRWRAFLNHPVDYLG